MAIRVIDVTYTIFGAFLNRSIDIQFAEKAAVLRRSVKRNHEQVGFWNGMTANHGSEHVIDAVCRHLPDKPRET